MKGIQVLVLIFLVLTFTPTCAEARFRGRNLVTQRDKEYMTKILSVKKFPKGVKNSDLNDAVDDLLDNEIVKDVQKALKKALDKPFKQRSTDLFNNIKNGGVDAWEDMLCGFDSISSYFENQFVDDLEWLGKQIAEGWGTWCDLPMAQAATAMACSYGLNAAICSLTSGAAPYCTAAPMTDVIKKKINQGLMRNVLTCTVYRGLKAIEGNGWCNGRAMGLSEGIANILVNNPFLPVCNTAMACACGSCPWECDFPINAACEGDAFRTDLIAFTSQIAELFK